VIHLHGDPRLMTGRHGPLAPKERGADRACPAARGSQPSGDVGDDPGWSHRPLAVPMAKAGTSAPPRHAVTPPHGGTIEWDRPRRSDQLGAAAWQPASSDPLNKDCAGCRAGWPGTGRSEANGIASWRGLVAEALVRGRCRPNSAATSQGRLRGIRHQIALRSRRACVASRPVSRFPGRPLLSSKGGRPRRGSGQRSLQGTRLPSRHRSRAPSFGSGWRVPVLSSRSRWCCPGPSTAGKAADGSRCARPLRPPRSPG